MDAKSFSTEVMAHELAHQWFGDLGQKEAYTEGRVNFSEFEITVCGSCKM